MPLSRLESRSHGVDRALSRDLDRSAEGSGCLFARPNLVELIGDVGSSSHGEQSAPNVNRPPPLVDVTSTAWVGKQEEFLRAIDSGREVVQSRQRASVR